MIDTPPSGPVSDCALLARWMDGLVLIVTAHKTPRKQLENALNMLEGAPVLGIIFNRDDKARAGYRRDYRWLLPTHSPTPASTDRVVPSTHTSKRSRPTTAAARLTTSSGIRLMATIERSHTLEVFRSRALCFSLAFVGVWGVSLPPDVHVCDRGVAGGRVPRTDAGRIRVPPRDGPRRGAC